MKAREMKTMPGQGYTLAAASVLATGCHGTSLRSLPARALYVARTFMGVCRQLMMGFGQLEEKDGSLFLKWAFPNSELATTIGNRFRPVRWGDQRYLIAEKEMLNFCNAVNSGEAPKHGVASDFFLREGDEKKQAAGLPALPDPWRGHLLERPLSAKIISVSAAPESQHNVENPHERMVTLNVGKKQGVFVGMKFHRQELDIPFHVFRVSRVGDSTSEAESFLLYNYESVVSKPPPTVGWELSTISSEGSANRQKDDGAPR